MNDGLQDGMRDHYNRQVRASDVNVERRLDREPFDFREYLQKTENAYGRRELQMQKLSRMVGVDEHGCVLPPSKGMTIDRSPNQFWKSSSSK